MPLEAPLPALEERVADLNARFKHRSATQVMSHALTDPEIGPLALVSSFGAESVVLLHMVSRVDRSTPVIFLDTQMLFQETLEYQVDVSKKLGLTDVRTIHPDADQVFKRDPDNILHLADTDACCNLRKVEPLANAIAPFDGWITGRKRFQGGKRVDLEFFEIENGRIKVNPLAHWAADDVKDYMINNRLPRHPLVGRGFPSIGCAPCTSAVKPGEDPRAGRWRGAEKSECGIHFVDGKIQRIASSPEQGD
ncbi:phosphoadenylyl-sulfate reductase [Aliiroseovarius lamellibrachiae]|uniref:phosphoadenylyl-sulfate reductase n=1 Tax=Aliiroseovarius lamellibrachiae TaxID=1924933 RepID=UPI001BE0727D|nr:phosphoadenylyl-sulfate reductase [Aliiroseovarius lamellibrachiae]MBT2130736.1 phosphoadenylyl-sulfate reductase [Aliiroseovarius lamellibrachiae]